MTNPRRPSPARRAGRALACAALAALPLAGSACGGLAPQQDVTAAQVVIDLTDAVNDLRQENALLQAQIDSLRGEVARQDTLVRQLAGAMGVLPR